MTFMERGWALDGSLLVPLFDDSGFYSLVLEL
jgi:hypothetical protein